MLLLKRVAETEEWRRYVLEEERVVAATVRAHGGGSGEQFRMTRHLFALVSQNRAHGRAVFRILLCNFSAEVWDEGCCSA
jgi:hypothetical protein